MRTIEILVDHSLGHGKHVAKGDKVDVDDKEATRKVALGYAKFAEPANKKSGPATTAAGKIENRDPQGS